MLKNVRITILFFHFRFNHGLWTPNEAFFHRSPIFLGFGQTNYADKFWGIWGTYFGPFISTQFGTVSPLDMFFINQPLFLQKTRPLDPNPKYLLGIGI